MRLALLMPGTGGQAEPLATPMDLGANFGVLTQALRAQAPVADGTSVTAEGDVLVFTLPSVRFGAQVSRSGFGDDLVGWLKRVAGTLLVGKTEPWPGRSGVRVQTNPLLPTLVFTHTRLGGPVLLSVDDLEVLLGGAVAEWWGGNARSVSSARPCTDDTVGGGRRVFSPLFCWCLTHDAPVSTQVQRPADLIRRAVGT